MISKKNNREKAPRVDYGEPGTSQKSPDSSSSGQSKGRGRRRQIYEIVETRPENVTCKQGKSGHEISLRCNYFKLQTTPTWRIYQYHVDFEPNIESRRVRCGLLSEFRDILCGYIFDGTKAFTNTRLRDDCLEVQATSRRQESIKITIKYVGVISMTEWQSLQVLNLILRRSIEGLKLQLVGRNFYDAVAKVNVRDFNIHQDRDFQESFKRQVIGSTVLTDYNNKTYRIDDVLFDKSAMDTFRCKDVEKSFVDYYYEKYHIRIKDPRQPLLLTYSRKKVGKGNAATQDTIILIPELCRATGITDNMRANFQLTRAMGDITRLNPDRRIERLLMFNKRLQEQSNSMKVLKDWNMTLDSKLVELKGRVIDPQQIVFLDRKKVSAGEQADWTKHFRDNAMLTSPSRGLYNWFAVTPQRNARECRQFIELLIRSAGGMRFKIERPREV
uniref:PAZ domain-containing protein n=1 Tax=Megaselia scalaris TaxID=36166 RepID=T1GQW8_MEGSC